MPLLGRAAVAMWWDVDARHREEFEDWHSHEHFPERMGIEGFRRGSRWASAAGGEGFFVMYELDDYETLTSPGYLARLNAPTPWSTKMMPHHRNMVRSQCRVLASYGAGIAGSLLTIRLAPRRGSDRALRNGLSEALAKMRGIVGITGAHLIQNDTPNSAATREQVIRGGDKTADWIVMVGGYDGRAVADVGNTQLGDEVLAGLGAQDHQVRDFFVLCHSITPFDL
jgi:hypothetical protein